MNKEEKTIYEVLEKVTGQKVESFKDDDEFIQIMEMDSLTTTMFIVEIENAYSKQIPWYKFNKNITFGKFKEIIEHEN